ncbi:MAG: CoA transferase, partial [Acidimicrobiia bacterium]|nr:CoA transferase [Acidimicrobiia bacterium]
MSGGPLDGVVVVAFEAIGPVPFACRVLSSLGARIVTIARPPSIARALPEDLRATSAPVGVTVAIDIKEP